MYKFLTKNGQLLAFGFGMLITIIFLLMVFPNIDTFNPATDKDSNIFNFGLYAAIALSIIGVLAWLAFGFFHMATNIKAATKGIIGFAVLLVIFFIARSIGSDDVAIMDTIGEFNISDGESATISGGIITTLVLLALTVLVFVFSEIRNFFK